MSHNTVRMDFARFIVVFQNFIFHGMPLENYAISLKLT